MSTFLTRMRQALRRTDTTRTGAESLAATDTPTTADSSAETPEGTPAVHERRVSHTGAAETAAYTEAADRTADRLELEFYREMDAANTPIQLGDDAEDDVYGPDHSADAYDALREHLIAHPGLRDHAKWANEYAAIDAETTRPNTAEADAEIEADAEADAEAEAEAGSASPFDAWIPLNPYPPDATLGEPQDDLPGHPDYVAEPEYYPPGHPDHVFASQEAEDRFWDTWEAKQEARATRETEAANRAAEQARQAETNSDADGL